MSTPWNISVNGPEVATWSPNVVREVLLKIDILIAGGGCILSCNLIIMVVSLSVSSQYFGFLLYWPGEAFPTAFDFDQHPSTILLIKPSPSKGNKAIG